MKAALYRRQWPEWLVGLTVMLGAMAFGCIPRWRERLFYFWGDNAESFFPLWHHMGTQLRHGQWLTMDPAGWMGGNYAGEAAYGIFNPVTMGNAVLISYFDDLATGTFIVMVEFIGLLALGVYLLSREYGATRGPAAAVGLAAPFAGFTLFYGAGNWASGLMAFTWLVHFWWSLRRHARGELNPLVPFAFGLLTATVGSPYGLVAMVIVGAAVVIEVAVRRDYRRLGHVAVLGACVAAGSVLVYLPLMLTVPVTLRSIPAHETNNAYLVPDFGDLAGMSSITFRPTMPAWFSEMDHVPSTYLAWFVLPLLPWISFASLRRQWRNLVSLALVGSVYLLLTVSPSTLWLFRWPLRVIEYFYVVVLVFFAVALSAGPHRDKVRPRLLGTAAILFGGWYLAWAAQPELLRRHVVGLALVVGLSAACFVAYRWWGMRGLVTGMVSGIAVVLGLQSMLFWWNSPYNTPVEAVQNIGTAHDLSRLRQTVEPYEGTVLQVASVKASGLSRDDLESGRVMFGNVGAAAGLDTVTRYTGLGFTVLIGELNIDYRGEVAPYSYSRLWERAGTASDVTLVDAMRVSTIVMQNSYADNFAGQPVPEGWRVRLVDDTRTVLVRTEPLPYPADVSWASRGVDVEELGFGPTQTRLRVDVPAGGGSVLLSRLNWPGYTATVDGQPTTLVEKSPAGLVMVDLPAGQHELAVDYRTPGLTVGLLALVAATVVALAHAIGYALLRRRRRAVVLIDQVPMDDLPIGDTAWNLEEHQRDEVGVPLEPLAGTEQRALLMGQPASQRDVGPDGRAITKSARLP